MLRNLTSEAKVCSVKKCKRLLGSQDSEKNVIDPQLKQHCAMSDFHKMARLINDNEAVIVNALEREEWPRAMKILEEENDAQLYYKYSSSLLSHVPSALCQGKKNPSL